jgi:uncharacterized protein (DUF2249 family)
MSGMTVHTLDNRGLEPPEPMVRIFDALNELKAGEELHALMDREPILIYSELERRGFAWRFDDDGDSQTLVVWREA